MISNIIKRQSKLLLSKNHSLRFFARKSRGSISKMTAVPAVPNNNNNNQAPPPATTDEDPWVEVKDDATGGIYYWNTKTDETTAVGEPKPTQVAKGGVMSGLGGVVAEGFAFGVGASVARSVVGSFFGGGDDGGGEGGGDDGYF